MCERSKNWLMERPKWGQSEAKLKKKQKSNLDKAFRGQGGKDDEDARHLPKVLQNLERGKVRHAGVLSRFRQGQIQADLSMGF